MEKRNFISKRIKNYNNFLKNMKVMWTAPAEKVEKILKIEQNLSD